MWRTSSTPPLPTAAAIACASSTACRADIVVRSGVGTDSPEIESKLDSSKLRDPFEAIFCAVALCFSSSALSHTETVSEPVIKPIKTEVNDSGVESLRFTAAARANAAARSCLTTSLTCFGDGSTFPASRSYVNVTVRTFSSGFVGTVTSLQKTRPPVPRTPLWGVNSWACLGSRFENRAKKSMNHA